MRVRSPSASPDHTPIAYGLWGLPAGIAQLVEQLICNQQVGGSSPSTGSTYPGAVCTETDCKAVTYNTLQKKNTKEDTKLKQITKEEMTLLLDKGIVRNSHRGIVDKNGFTVGFYRTRNRRYIEDKYVGIARKLS